MLRGALVILAVWVLAHLFFARPVPSVPRATEALHEGAADCCLIPANRGLYAQ